MPKKSGFKGVPTIKPIRPIKPIDKLQALKPIPKIGQSEGVKGHWRLNPKTNHYDWVNPHWRKP